MSKTLSAEEIRDALKILSGWSQGSNAIEREFAFRDFNEALLFVNTVGLAAERANHHPDIDIRYKQVKMLLTSHDSGGVTRRDTKMAKQINALYDACQRAEFD